MPAPSLSVNIQGIGAVTADDLNTFNQTCNNVSELREISGISGMQVDVRGAVVSGDGLGGQFYWNSTSTASDDGLTVLQPVGAAAAGRWLLLPLSGGPILGNYANDAAAALAGVLIGAFYRNGSVVQIRVA